jgi:uncharacterized protein
MRWRRGAGGGRIEDRRGRGGGLALPVGGGLGGIGLLVALLVVFLGGGGGGGIDVGPSLDPFPNMPAADEPFPAGSDPDAELVEFVGFVVDDVQDSWARSFAEAGRRYEPTTLVLFRQATTSGCGAASAAVGPFYCPADRKVYLDLGFFRELRSRFGAPGDFAQAYVIAHEFGHHVQNLLAISGDVQRAQQENPDEANELSVRLELQADCLAGVWAFSAYEQELLEPGDLEEGLGAAAAVGDDRLQQQAGAQENPETWTHGSSEQRVAWFQRGFESGDANDCDTFSAEI